MFSKSSVLVAIPTVTVVGRYFKNLSLRLALQLYSFYFDGWFFPCRRRRHCRHSLRSLWWFFCFAVTFWSRKMLCYNVFQFFLISSCQFSYCLYGKHSSVTATWKMWLEHSGTTQEDKKREGCRESV